MGNVNREVFIFKMDDDTIDECVKCCSPNPNVYNLVESLIQDAKTGYMYISEISGFEISDLHSITDESLINLCRLLYKKYPLVKEVLPDILNYRNFDNYYLNERI